jgi:hypothetical protein
MQWLFWQMGGLGPMLGQNHHFRNYIGEKIPYAVERYVKETERLYGILDERLEDREFVAGEYSIADMACYPWIVLHDRQGQNLDDYSNIKRWFDTIQRRDAVQRAYAIAKTVNTAPPGMTEEAKKIHRARGGAPKQNPDKQRSLSFRESLVDGTSDLISDLIPFRSSPHVYPPSLVWFANLNSSAEARGVGWESLSNADDSSFPTQQHQHAIIFATLRLPVTSGFDFPYRLLVVLDVFAPAPGSTVWNRTS